MLHLIPAMNRILLVVFCSMLFLSTQAAGVLKGTITTKDAKAITGASIYIKALKKGAVSDERGAYLIEQIPSGSFMIRVSHVGFQSQERMVTIKEGETVVADFTLEPSVILTEEVVVTATRVERNITQVPGRIYVIKSKTLEALPLLSADDMMQVVPGVQVSRGSGIFSNKAIVTMRGLGGKEQSRVLVLLDGVPVNKTDGGSVNWNMLNIAGISRVEIAKGPASSIYGSNAMGGIIQIFTKKPDTTLTGAVTFKGGSFGTLGGNLWLGGRFKTKKEKKDRYLYWTLTGMGTDSKGYFTEPSDSLRETDSTIVRTYLKEYGAGAKLGYVINPGHSVEAEVNYYDDWRGSGIKVVEPTGGFTRHATWQARGRYRVNQGIFNIAVNAFLQRENYHAMNESFKDYSYKLYDVSSIRSDFGVLVNVTQPLFKNNELTEGIDIRQGAVNASDVYYTSTDKVNNAGKMNFYALYLQDEYSFWKDRMQLIAGVRYDYSNYFDGLFNIESPSTTTSFLAPFVDENISDASWQAFSPKVSLQYRPVQNLRMYIAVAQGFRPPILDDMCRSGKIRGGFKLANASLQPETITNYEFGADFKLFNKLFFEASAYYSRGKDFMYYVSTGDSVDLGYYPLTPVYMRKNISRVEISGIEAGFRYQITTNLNAYINYAYTHAVVSEYKVEDTLANSDLTGKFLADVPKHSASCGIQWTNRIVNLSATARYVGAMYINDKNEYDDTYLLSDQYPEYITVDFKIGKQLWHHLNLAVDVQNVFDKLIYDSKNQVSAGRLIFGEVSYKF